MCFGVGKDTTQGLIQDFLLGGETIFLKFFGIFSDSRTDEFSNSYTMGSRGISE